MDEKELREILIHPSEAAVVLMRIHEYDQQLMANAMTPFNLLYDLEKQGHIKMKIELTDSGKTIAKGGLDMWPRFKKFKKSA